MNEQLDPLLPSNTVDDKAPSGGRRLLVLCVIAVLSVTAAAVGAIGATRARESPLLLLAEAVDASSAAPSGVSGVDATILTMEKAFDLIAANVHGLEVKCTNVS